MAHGFSFSEITLISCISFIALLYFAHKSYQQHHSYHKTSVLSSPLQTNEFVEQPSPSSPLVLMDLNDVLLDFSSSAAFKFMGAKIAFWFWQLWGTSMDKPVERVFEFLSLIEGETLEKIDPESPHIRFIPTYRNMRIPGITVAWMKGDITTAELLKKIETGLDTFSSFFTSTKEKKVIAKLVQLFFDPHVRAKVYRLIPKGVKLAKLCKKYGYRLILVSNMDADIIPLLQEKYPDLFNLFDDMVISANIHMIKPEKKIFEYLIQHFSLTPKDTYFIDDQPSNVAAAREFGITSFLFGTIRRAEDLFPLTPDF
ncbi:MAG: HAD-IA family hydrolase [Candidatus Babeliales bacterium]